MKLNDLRDNKGARKRRVRVGRGIGSGLGKTAGRGQKGQKSRSGVSVFGFEGGQMPLHMRLPKRGFNNIFAKDYAEVNLGAIQKAIDAGKLDAKGVIDHDGAEGRRPRRAAARTASACSARASSPPSSPSSVAGVSAGARKAVEEAGGSVELIEVVPAADKAAAKKNSVKKRQDGRSLSSPPRLKADKPEPITI